MDECKSLSLLTCLSTAGPLEQAKFWISVASLLSLIGLIATLLSLRVTVCNQIYSRWQTLLFKFADTPGAHAYLTETEYRSDISRDKAHYIAVGYINLFEEVFRYHRSRVLLFVPLLPNDFWISIENSMSKQFQKYLYLRTLWKSEESSFSSDFNEYIRLSVRPFDTRQ